MQFNVDDIASAVKNNLRKNFQNDIFDSFINGLSFEYRIRSLQDLYPGISIILDFSSISSISTYLQLKPKGNYVTYIENKIKSIIKDINGKTIEKLINNYPIYEINFLLGEDQIQIDNVSDITKIELQYPDRSQQEIQDKVLIPIQFGKEVKFKLKSSFIQTPEEVSIERYIDQIYSKLDNILNYLTNFQILKIDVKISFEEEEYEDRRGIMLKRPSARPARIYSNGQVIDKNELQSNLLSLLTSETELEFETRYKILFLGNKGKTDKEEFEYHPKLKITNLNLEKFTFNIYLPQQQGGRTLYSRKKKFDKGELLEFDAKDQVNCAIACIKNGLYQVHGIKKHVDKNYDYIRKDLGINHNKYLNNDELKDVAEYYGAQIILVVTENNYQDYEEIKLFDVVDERKKILYLTTIEYHSYIFIKKEEGKIKEKRYLENKHILK